MTRIFTSVLVCITTAAAACTGYAVYADETWYGMNFDYPPESEIRFNVSQWENGRIFAMSFFDNDLDIWIPTVAMNEAGLFSSLQYQCPMVDGEPDPGESQRCIWQLFLTSVREFSSMEEVETFIDSYELVNMQDLTLHALVADTSGKALIAEAGEGNLITRIDKNWIVMTNFKVADFVDIPLDEIVGVGDCRYRNALSYIEDHYGSFDLEDAIGTLEAAAPRDEVWSTKASMVFDPSGRTVYLCIDGDFEHIWKISMDSLEIGTFQGFEGEASSRLEEDGITATQLREWLSNS